MIKNKTYNYTGTEIAVIGLSGRFPNADSINEFWDIIKSGQEAISFLSDEEIGQLNISDKILNNPNYVKSKGGIIKDKELFDAYFFGYSATEAEIMSPQLRFLHECCWEAIEDAGYIIEKITVPVGLYIGVCDDKYWQAISYRSQNNQTLGSYNTMILTQRDFFPTRISYKLNLKGPSLLIQTACSTSLVTIHTACQAILSGECAMALAGGVSFSSRENSGYFYQEGMILSKDGRCRAFDKDSSGTVSGEGIGIVLIKSLEQAISDHDPIYAIIKGTAINNDGNRKLGYTAPSRIEQANVINICQQIAEVAPESITYIETHGTGTPLGDPIEISALIDNFPKKIKQYCAIGALKSNIGHLDVAAGVAGFIKTTLAIKNRKIPPIININIPNPNIDFDNSPFYINTELKEWKTDGYPLRAAVSSFGIGGTNAHVILEEAPSIEDTISAEKPAHIFLLSAKSQNALENSSINLLNFLKNNSSEFINDITYTLNACRSEFAHRKFVICKDIDNAIKKLSDNGIPINIIKNNEKKDDIVFMFPGQGSQYINMGIELYKYLPFFQNELIKCFSLIELTGINTIPIIYPNKNSNELKNDISNTYYAQPILFAFEYSLAKYLMFLGIMPDIMIGHGVGEYVAACLSGVITLEDAINLITFRGKIIQSLPTGSMLNVFCNIEKLEKILPSNISVAAINSPANCAVSGNKEDINSFAIILQKQNIQFSTLQTSHAFHSHMMDPIILEFENKVMEINFNDPNIPYISNVYGSQIIKKEDVCNPNYWSMQLRNTVNFSKGIQTIFNTKNKSKIFIEVGPGNSLYSLLKSNELINNYKVFNLIKHPKEDFSDYSHFLENIGMLWANGIKINWETFYSFERAKKIHLPTYPFDRKRFWLDFPSKTEVKKLKVENKINDLNRPDVSFYIPSWKRLNVIQQEDVNKNNLCILCFVSENDELKGVLKKLKTEGHKVIQIHKGDIFKKIDLFNYEIDLKDEIHYNKLFVDLIINKLIPDKIFHFLCYSSSDSDSLSINDDSFSKIREIGFNSLIYIAKSAQKENITNLITLYIITNNMHNVIQNDLLFPEKNILIGPLKVIPQEYSNIKCINIDFSVSSNDTLLKEKLVDIFLEEIKVNSLYTIVAYRHLERWVQCFEQAQIKKGIYTKFKKKGIYIITGGLGLIGLRIAEYLSKDFEAQLVLIGKSKFIEKNDWEKWIKKESNNNITSSRILKLKQIEENSNGILILQADIANYAEVKKVIEITENKYGKIDGIIHAAGIVNGDSIDTIQNIKSDCCEDQFKAKVYGLNNLYECLKNHKLDFFIIFSSLSAILGGLKLVAYSSSNAYMDAFVKKNNSDNLNMISINWDGWEDEKSMQAFKNIFYIKNTSQLIISNSDNLHRRIDDWINFISSKKIDNNEGNSLADKRNDEQKSNRPECLGEYQQPNTSIEKELIIIWQNFFGIYPIGIADNFFELGGDSLKMLSLLAKINNSFSVNISLEIMFSNPTIENLADQVRMLKLIYDNNKIDDCSNSETIII